MWGKIGYNFWSFNIGPVRRKGRGEILQHLKMNCQQLNRFLLKLHDLQLHSFPQPVHIWYIKVYVSLVFSKAHADDLNGWVPCDSLKRENSALIAVLGKEGRRSRSSCRRDTWDCLCVAGMCWVREIRKRTRPTSSNLRVNTCNLKEFKPHCTVDTLIYIPTHFHGYISNTYFFIKVNVTNIL